MIDFEAFGTVLRETGYDGLATVEQDMYRPPLDVPLPIARRTREYLREIGIG
jgi:inosose dehydratase